MFHYPTKLGKVMFSQVNLFAGGISGPMSFQGDGHAWSRGGGGGGRDGYVRGWVCLVLGMCRGVGLGMSVHSQKVRFRENPGIIFYILLHAKLFINSIFHLLDPIIVFK